MTKASNYLGTAGELHIASELALRGYVVHVPMTDEGGDLFLVRESDGVTGRIQVKASLEGVHPKLPGYPAFTFTIKSAMLSAPNASTVKNKLLCAMLMIATNSKSWSTTLVIPARVLLKLSPLQAGSPSKTIWIIVDPATGDLHLGGKGGYILNRYAKNWDRFFPVVVGRSSI